MKIVTETIAALRAANVRTSNPNFGKAMHAAITLSGVLAPDQNPLYKRILRHAIVDMASASRPTWGRLLHGGLEETLVSPEHWGRFSQWGWGDTYQNEKDCPVLSGECATSAHGNGFTVIEVTVKVEGVWYMALYTGRRHNYVAVLFRDGELLRAFPLPSVDDEVQAAVDAEIAAVKSRIYAEEFIAYMPVPRDECMPSIWEARDFARELPPTPHAARAMRAAARLRNLFDESRTTRQTSDDEDRPPAILPMFNEYKIEVSEDGMEILITPPVPGVSCRWDEFSRITGDWVLTTPNGTQWLDTTAYAVEAIEEYLGISS